MENPLSYYFAAFAANDFLILHCEGSGTLNQAHANFDSKAVNTPSKTGFTNKFKRLAILL